jgi:hypothetical protein
MCALRITVVIQKKSQPPPVAQQMDKELGRDWASLVHMQVDKKSSSLLPEPLTPVPFLWTHLLKCRWLLERRPPPIFILFSIVFGKESPS